LFTILERKYKDKIKIFAHKKLYLIIIMVLFFFYNKLTNIELLKKINTHFEINDGFVFVDEDDYVLVDYVSDNQKILHGKIVEFNMPLENVISKINQIEECKIKNKNSKYTLDVIYATKSSGEICKTYIIY
jgi:hypothetical protein